MRKALLIFICSTPILACTNNSQQNTPSETTIELSDSNSVVQNDSITIGIKDTLEDIYAEYIFNPAGFNQSFDFRAYINDPDNTEPTNIRESPNGKIIQKLPQGEDYMFNIIAQKDGWFQIKNLVCFSDEIEINHTNGWIHASVVGASTRYCCDQGVPLYKYPDASDTFYIGQIPFEQSVQIKELYFDFALVEYKSENNKKLEGWIQQEWICGNPVTTCP